MIEPAQGFAIDDVDYRWGTLPGDIVGMGALPATIGYFHRDLPCRAALGFSAAGVKLSAPAPDRPVLGATYELAAPWLGRAKPDHWLDALRKTLGAPTESGHENLSAYRDPSSGVAHWARWQGSTLDIHLSIYGGTRPGPLGRSAGLIGLVWSDTIAAAAPFVSAWRASSAALANAAQSVQAFQRFDMPAPLRAIGAADDATADLIAARRALHDRAIFATPQPIGVRLDSHSLAIWQSAVDGQWALSNLWDTALLSGARVRWSETKPARGGGSSELSVGGLTVRPPYGTPSIAAAAAALEALPGVVVEYDESYDV